jgi:zinc/manganese transport system substrate-binding protein
MRVVTIIVMRRVALAAALLAAALGASACTSTAAAGSDGRVVAVGAENEYADVIAQIGGKYVDVTAVMSNPGADPHSFESSPSIAGTVASAQLVVQNGLGYDTFMQQIEQAAPAAGRTVIVVQELLGLPGSTPNPHLWYDPRTMPAVAKAVGAALAAVQPSHKAYFLARVAAFDRSLQPWARALASDRAAVGGAAAATTEPVADDLLQAMGVANATPFPFQADVMNGVDPSPQDVATEEGLLRSHRAKVLVYNQQVTDTLTESLLSLAHAEGIPVVGVYETMPTPGYDYQTWMLAETRAIVNAIEHGESAARL